MSHADSVEPTKHLAIKAVMMPRDTNPHGTIFGGVLMSFIDQAGVVGAQHWMESESVPERTLVTVAMNKVEFHQPVFVGDIVSFWTTVTRVGRTSITMQVSVSTTRNRQEVQLTEAEVTYVAIETVDGERTPVSIRS